MRLREQAVKWTLSLLTLGVLLLLLLLIRFPRISRQKPPLLEMTVLLREEGGSAGIYLRQGMEQAAADFNVELRFLLPASPGDGEEQRQLLHREVENGAAAILLFPADRGVLAEEVRAGSATAALVTLETDMRGEGARGYAGVDNAALGQAVAKAALNGVREGETVLLIHRGGGALFCRRGPAPCPGPPGKIPCPGAGGAGGSGFGPFGGGAGPGPAGL